MTPEERAKSIVVRLGLRPIINVDVVSAIADAIRAAVEAEREACAKARPRPRCKVSPEERAEGALLCCIREDCRERVVEAIRDAANEARVAALDYAEILCRTYAAGADGRSAQAVEAAKAIETAIARVRNA